jgi:hypothetical protein
VSGPTMLNPLERTEEGVAPPAGPDNPITLFRALPLALALSLLCWGALAALAYGLYVLLA